MNINEQIRPLQLNGLTGRVLRLDGPKPDAPEVLFIYGHHSSLERWQGVAELFTQHFNVTMPDLPGFGGMQSLYRIKKTATVDNLADYVADFISANYQGKKVTVIGMSLGFVIVTRALQRHPDITKYIDNLISLFGFAHTDDFIMSAKGRRKFKLGTLFFSLPISSNVYRTLLLNRFVLSRTYHRTPNAREKFKNATPEQHKANMEFEIGLWQNDDLRTYMKTANEFLTLDNTQVKVPLPVYHIAVQGDRYFDNARVEAHFRQIFSDYHLLAELTNGSHAPTRVANAKQAEELIPPALLSKIVALTSK